MDRKRQDSRNGKQGRMDREERGNRMRTGGRAERGKREDAESREPRYSRERGKREDAENWEPRYSRDRERREDAESREPWYSRERERREDAESREPRYSRERERREDAENREPRYSRDRTRGRAASGQDEADGVIEGRNAVIEALRAGIRLDKVYIQKSADDQSGRADGQADGRTDERNGGGDHTLGFIASTARAAGAVVVDADRRKLDAMSRTRAHQGVIALASVREYVPVEDILALAAERGEPPLLVACDGITDPGNLGAILRTAECAGAHGVILPKRRSAGLTAVVAKTSAGAVSHMLVSRVANLPSLLKDLKKQGVWVYGAAAEGDASLYRTDFQGPAAIVIGSEGGGLSRLVREICDALVSIPLRGEVGSLNASAAAAVLLYEAVRQRSGET